MYCNEVFPIRPTNKSVHGFLSQEVLDWNNIDMPKFGTNATKCHATVEDGGMFIVFCTPSEHRPCMNSLHTCQDNIFIVSRSSMLHRHHIQNHHQMALSCKVVH